MNTQALFTIENVIRNLVNHEPLKKIQESIGRRDGHVMLQAKSDVKLRIEVTQEGIGFQLFSLRDTSFQHEGKTISPGRNGKEQKVIAETFLNHSVMNAPFHVGERAADALMDCLDE